MNDDYERIQDAEKEALRREIEKLKEENRKLKDLIHMRSKFLPIIEQKSSCL